MEVPLFLHIVDNVENASHLQNMIHLDLIFKADDCFQYSPFGVYKN